MLVCGGLALVIYDSITFGPNNESPHYYDFKNYLFLQRTWWERVTFDLVIIYILRLLSVSVSLWPNFRNSPQIWVDTTLPSSQCSWFRI